MDDADHWWDSWGWATWWDIAAFYATVIGLAMLTAWRVAIHRRRRGPDD